jgi:PAS domain-containing protein
MFTVEKSFRSKKTIQQTIIRVLLMFVTVALVALLSYMFGSHMFQTSLTEDAMSTRPFRELESMRVTVLVLGLLLISTFIYSRMYFHWQNKKMYGYTQLMFDKMPLGCSLWDESLNIIECNQELGRMLGLADRNEFPALFLSLSPKYQPCGTETRTKAHEVLVKAFAEGHCRTEWEHVSMSGELIPCEIIYQRVEYQRGFFVVAYVRDLREQRAMFEKIREADEQQRILLDCAPLNCSLWDINRNISYCDKETVDLLGLPAEEYSLHKILDLSPMYQPCGRESADIAREHEEAAFADGYCRFDWTFQAVNGELIPCETTLIRVMHRGENVLAAYIRDLREQKAMIEKIREADEQQRILLDYAPLNCSLWDSNHNIAYCDNETVNLFGLPANKYSMYKILDLSPKYQPCGRESAEMAREHEEAVYADGYCRFDWTFQALNGELIPCETTLIHVTQRGEHMIAAYCRDLRERAASGVNMIDLALMNMNELKDAVDVMRRAEENLRLALTAASR